MSEKKLLPKKDRKGRYVLDVPRSVTGKRLRFYFHDHAEALRKSAEMIVDISLGKSIQPNTSTPTIEHFAAMFLAEQSLKVGSHTMRSLRWGLKLLVEKFGKLTPDRITPDMASSWVKSQDYSTRGRFNIFAISRTLFNWRTIRQIVSVNPFDDPPPKNDKGHRLAILTPDQMRSLLDADLPQWFRTWVICGGFAGLRTAEQQRMGFDAFDFEFKEIIVRKEQSKQGEAARPRSVSMQSAFIRQWAGKIIPTHDPLLSGKYPSDFSVLMPVALKALGLDAWPKNCLRHSFASYHLAHFRDASRTAFEMGHTSPTLLYQTYANSVSRRDAEMWWNL